MTGSYWDGKRVLVAGGAGMIGSYLAELLIEDGARVRVADSLEGGTLKNLANCRNQIEFLELDLRSKENCLVAVRGCQVVTNLAAKTVGIGYSSNHHGEMFHDSALLSLNLMEAAREAGTKRYLVVSSSCVYPDDATVPTPESEGEVGLPEKANEGYGWAKRLAELQGRYYAKEYGMEVAIVRPANVYAPRYNWRQKDAHVIPALAIRILSREDPLVVWGSGRQTRSFMHARDTALAMKLVTERAATAEPVNIGPLAETSVGELVTELARLAGYQGRIIFDTSKPEGPRRKSPSLEKQVRIMPEFEPHVSLSEGLREVLDSARAFLAQGHDGQTSRP